MSVSFAAKAARHLRGALEELPAPRRLRSPLPPPIGIEDAGEIETIGDPRFDDVREAIERALAMVAEIEAVPLASDDEVLAQHGRTRDQIAAELNMTSSAVAKRRRRRKR